MARRLATDSLAELVRDRLRTTNIDPQLDPVGVTGVINEVVAEYETQSLTGAVEVLEEPLSVIETIHADVAGFGPLQKYFDDPTVEEIWINNPQQVFVARHGRHEHTEIQFTTEEVRELVERMLRSSGRRLDVSQPFVDAMLPGGHRLHVVLDGIARDHMAINIRKFVARAHSLAELVELGTLTEEAARFLEACVVAGLNIVVSGGTQAGKTTLLNCMLAAVPPTQRLITCEEVFELQTDHQDWVGMQTRIAGLEGTGAVELRTLVKEALRMRPSRIIIGEVRGAESLDMLLALNSGLPGMASLHANSARQALVKMCTLPLLAGENIGSRFVVPTVAASVDIVVQTALAGSGKRSVREIVALTGRVENEIIEAERVFFDEGAGLRRGNGRPVRTAAFAAAGIDIDEILRPNSWAH